MVFARHGKEGYKLKVEGHKNTSRKPDAYYRRRGEIGQELIRHLTMAKNEANIVTLDRNALDETSRRRVGRAIVGDILDAELLASLWNDYEIETVFHLAALLSTRAERDPELAYRVNVQGTLNLLKLATDHGRLRGQAVKFVYPSSIAVYGLPDLETKRRAGAVREDQYLQPTTMYGCNKLSCEHLGNYYAEHYQQVADRNTIRVDFRCIRFPGLISIQTTPAGGTSDFAPEMVHAAAESRPYAAFVRPGTQIPFMVMPDAVKSLLMLTERHPRIETPRL